MTLNYGPRLDSISLTAGAGLVIPSASLRGVYPVGTTAQLVFTDSQHGVVLGTFDGTVSVNGIAFSALAGAVASIPHGAYFVVYATMPTHDPVALAWGTVVRAEPRYPSGPTVGDTDFALQFVADFTGPDLDPRWVPAGGALTLRTSPNSLGAAGAPGGSARWFVPMNMDSVTVNLTLENRGATPGVFQAIVCSDAAMTSCIGVSFNNVSSGVGTVNTWKASGGISTSSSTVNHLVEDGNNYVIRYNHLTGTLSCEFEDDVLISNGGYGSPQAHGLGYRYPGLIISGTPAGIELTGYEVRDGV